VQSIARRVPLRALCVYTTWRQNKNIRRAFARKRAILRVAAHPVCVVTRLRTYSRETERGREPGNQPCIDRVFSLLRITFRTKCPGIALMAFRSTFESCARNAPSRTYVWIITRACGEFAIIADVLSPWYRSPSVQQDAFPEERNKSRVRPSFANRKSHEFISGNSSVILDSFMGLLVGERTTVTDMYVI